MEKKQSKRKMGERCYRQFRGKQIQMAHKHKKLLKGTSSQRSAKPCTKEPQTQAKFEKEITIREGR